MQKLKHMISKEIENWVDRNCFEWLIWCCLWWHIAGEWGWWIADEGNRRRQACWAKTSKKVDSRWGPKWDSGASHRGIIPQSRLLQRDLTISSQQTISQSHIQTPIIFAPGDLLEPSCKLFIKCSLHLLGGEASNVGKQLVLGFYTLEVFENRGRQNQKSWLSVNHLMSVVKQNVGWESRSLCLKVSFFQILSDLLHRSGEPKVCHKIFGQISTGSEIKVTHISWHLETRSGHTHTQTFNYPE